MRSKLNTLPSTPRSKEFGDMREQMVTVAKRTMSKYLQELNGGKGWQTKQGSQEDDIKAAARILLCENEPEITKLLSEVAQKTPHEGVREIISEGLGPEQSPK